MCHPPQGLPSAARERGPAGFRLGYRPVLDGIRGLGVLVVMAAHSHLHRFLPGAHLYLDIFFVLSGFLITALLWQDYERTGSLHLKQFYQRRALRLFPALALVLAACAGYAACWKEPAQARVIYRAVLATGCYIANCDWWTGIDLNLLGQCWTLSLEEQFYLCWPILLAGLLWLRVRRGGLLAIVLSLAGGAALLRAGLWTSAWPAAREAARTSLPARADSFLAGCLVGLVASWNWLPLGGGPRRALQVAAWGAVPVLAVLIAQVPEGATVFYCGGLTLVLAAAALIVAASVNAPPRPVAAVLGSPVLVWFGRVSYGLYLWHFPMLTFVPGLVRRLVPALAENVAFVEGLEFSLAVAAAALSFYLVEQPLLRRGARGAGAGAKKTEASLQRASESLCSVEDAAPLQEPEPVVTEIATGNIGRTDQFAGVGGAEAVGHVPQEVGDPLPHHPVPAELFQDIIPIGTVHHVDGGHRHGAQARAS